MKEPVIVELVRGGFGESRHEVDVVVAEPGETPSGWGHINRPVLARSSMKPIQAIPLVTSGALDALGLSEEHLALAAASHNGEPLHVQMVAEWLESIGLGIEHLECGVDFPMSPQVGHDLLRSGQEPDRRHHDCSGKHSGILSVCRHLGFDPSEYIDPVHPVQAQCITPAMEETLGISLSGHSPAIDGCGVPLFEVPLDRLAYGWSALTQSDHGRRILAAMVANPFLVAGTGRMCTKVMESRAGSLAVKTGAEGVFAGVHLESGVAWALKARDGATRASETALLWVLSELGFPVDFEMEPVLNQAGKVVGELRASI